MIANMALLNSTVLATTRMPFALAEDGFFPRAFTRIHPRYGTPVLAIVVSGAIYAAFAIVHADATALRLRLAFAYPPP